MKNIFEETNGKNGTVLKTLKTRYVILNTELVAIFNLNTLLNLATQF